MAMIARCNDDDSDYCGSRDESTDCTCVNYHFRSPSKFRLIIRVGDSGLLQSIKGISPVFLTHRLLAGCFSGISGRWQDVTECFRAASEMWRFDGPGALL